MDEMDSYRELIQENISYDLLLQENPYDDELIDGYVELMVDVCCSKRPAIRISGEEIPTEVVKSRFLKLNKEHRQPHLPPPALTWAAGSPAERGTRGARPIAWAWLWFLSSKEGQSQILCKLHLGCE